MVQLQNKIQFILDVIAPWAKIYGREPLYAFHEDTEYTKDYPDEWHNWVLSLTPKEQFDYVCRHKIPKKLIPKSLKDLEDLRQKITHLPASQAAQKISATHLKQKKIHELEKLLPLILLQANHTEHIYDLCGGAGNLSRQLGYLTKIPITTIDQDETLLKKGLKLNPHSHVLFLAGDLFNLNLHSPIPAKALSIGLHTCGNLSLKHFEFNQKNRIPKLINIGCCYLKMSPESWPWSQYLQDKNVKLNTFSLTLSTNGNSALSFEKFMQSKKIKSFRYALAIYLKWFERQNVFKEVGESPKTLYQKDFSYYFGHKIIEPKISKQKINDFFMDQKTQNEIEKLWAMDIIRWRMARILEVLILLDRQEYLKERGIETELREVFEEQISPRNLAIITI